MKTNNIKNTIGTGMVAIIALLLVSCNNGAFSSMGTGDSSLYSLNNGEVVAPSISSDEAYERMAKIQKSLSSLAVALGELEGEEMDDISELVDTPVPSVPGEAEVNAKLGSGSTASFEALATKGLNGILAGLLSPLLDKLFNKLDAVLSVKEVVDAEIASLLSQVGVNNPVADAAQVLVDNYLQHTVSIQSIIDLYADKILGRLDTFERYLSGISSVMPSFLIKILFGQAIGVVKSLRERMTDILIRQSS